MSTDTNLDFSVVCAEGKRLVNLTPEDEAIIQELAPLIIPHLDAVTESFYSTLLAVPATAQLLEGRVDNLRRTHRAWLESLFTQQIDARYTEWMSHIGSVHVKVRLPVEFMTSGTTLIQRELVSLVHSFNSLDMDKKSQAAKAILSLCGFSQLIMQKSYSEDTLQEELARFLTITGMSRKLFDNLASAF